MIFALARCPRSYGSIWVLDIFHWLGRLVLHFGAGAWVIYSFIVGFAFFGDKRALCWRSLMGALAAETRHVWDKREPAGFGRAGFFA